MGSHIFGEHQNKLLTDRVDLEISGLHRPAKKGQKSSSSERKFLIHFRH